MLVAFRIILGGPLPMNTGARSQRLRQALDTAGTVQDFRLEPYRKDGSNDTVASGALLCGGASRQAIERVAAVIGAGWKIEDTGPGEFTATLETRLGGRVAVAGVEWASLDCPVPR
jgi:hypothetical protein